MMPFEQSDWAKASDYTNDNQAIEAKAVAQAAKKAAEQGVVWNLLNGSAELAQGGGGWTAGKWRKSGTGTVSQASMPDSPVPGVSKGARIVSDGGRLGVCQDGFVPEQAVLTLSCWVRGPAGRHALINPAWSASDDTVPSPLVELTGDWQCISHTTTVGSPGSTYAAAFAYLTDGAAGEEMLVCAPMLCYGDTARGWAQSYREMRGVDGAQGPQGVPGSDGKDGKMLSAFCDTAADAKAKTASLMSAGTLTLEEGAAVSVLFKHGNTASSPSLDVAGTGAKAIKCAGQPYAYWEAGATVSMVFSDNVWQVCSAPVYASEATIGNPVGGNVHIDGSNVEVRKGGTALARFAAKLVELGVGAADAVIRLCGGRGELSVKEETYSVWQNGALAQVARAAMRLVSADSIAVKGGESAKVEAPDVTVSSNGCTSLVTKTPHGKSRLIMNEDGNVIIDTSWRVGNTEHGAAINLIGQTGEFDVDVHETYTDPNTTVNHHTYKFLTLGPTGMRLNMQAVGLQALPQESGTVDKSSGQGVNAPYYWKWVKYRDGTAECWGWTLARGVTWTSAWGSLFETSEQWGPTLPFTFSEAPEATVTATTESGGSTCGVELAGRPSPSKMPDYHLLRPNEYTTPSNIRVSMHVWGRWA